jgi:hypothetical protein
MEQMAAETVDAGNDARTGEGTGRFNDLNIARVVIQARLFGGGGLIHAAVGLSGGAGALLTKRSGFSRNA